MAGSKAPKFELRSPRVSLDASGTGVYASFTPYSAQAKKPTSAYAVGHILDLSASGAKLVSRLPLTGKIGDVIKIDFALDGSNQRITNEARIVRQANEYTFAVRFLNVEGPKGRLIESAIAHHITYRPDKPTGTYAKVLDWIAANQRGAILAFAGLAAAALIGTVIFLSSDEHQGKQLKSWGRDVPKEWYWDYVNKFNDAWK